MSAIFLDLRIAEPAWRAIDQLDAVCARALEAGRAEAGPHCRGEVAVLLTDDGEMQALNRDWRGRDVATDVLAFPADKADDGFLGDIALGHGVCARDAAEAGRALEAHLAHLLIHGLLHLIGHDHIEEEAARTMQAVEIKALERLGLPDPYSQGSSHGND